VRDDLGRTIVLRNRPRRVISLAPSVTEILYDLKAQDRLVAVDAASDYPPAARKKPRIGDFLKPNVEKIVSLRPDLIILSSATIDSRSLQELTSLVPTPVFVQKPGTLRDVLRSVHQLGEMLGMEAAAAGIIQKMQKTIVRVQKEVKGRPRPKVFIEIWGDPLMTAGKNTVIDDLITLAGGVNVAGKLSRPFPTYTLESLIAARPEVYLVAHTGTTLPKLKNRPGYRAIKAIRDGRLYQVDPDLVLRPTPRLMKGLVDMARKIHPEAF